MTDSTLTPDSQEGATSDAAPGCDRRGQATLPRATVATTYARKRDVHQRRGHRRPVPGGHRERAVVPGQRAHPGRGPRGPAPERCRRRPRAPPGDRRPLPHARPDGVPVLGVGRLLRPQRQLHPDRLPPRAVLEGRGPRGPAAPGAQAPAHASLHDLPPAAVPGPRPRVPRHEPAHGRRCVQRCGRAGPGPAARGVERGHRDAPAVRRGPGGDRPARWWAAATTTAGSTGTGPWAPRSPGSRSPTPSTAPPSTCSGSSTATRSPGASGRRSSSRADARRTRHATATTACGGPPPRSPAPHPHPDEDPDHLDQAEATGAPEAAGFGSRRGPRARRARRTPCRALSS